MLCSTWSRAEVTSPKNITEIEIIISLTIYEDWGLKQYLIWKVFRAVTETRANFFFCRIQTIAGKN